MLNKLKLLIVGLCLSGSIGHRYQVEQRDKEIFKPCPDYPDNFITQFGTEPDNVTILADDSYYVNGDIEILYDFDPKKLYKTSMEFFKKERGNWQKTVYTIIRADFCKALFDTSETWNSVVKNTPQHQRKCPLEKGQIFSLDFTAEPTFEMSSGSLEGEYWARFEAGDKNNLKEFCCLDAYFVVFRV